MSYNQNGNGNGYGNGYGNGNANRNTLPTMLFTPPTPQRGGNQAPQNTPNGGNTRHQSPDVPGVDEQYGRVQSWRRHPDRAFEQVVIILCDGTREELNGHDAYYALLIVGHWEYNSPVKVSRRPGVPVRVDKGSEYGASRAGCYKLEEDRNGRS